MKKFITQFKKAKENKMRLIWDGVNNRYLIIHSTIWQTWYNHKLIHVFK